MWKTKNKEAISPVIGVVLMVLITVVLAAVVYIWVTTIIPPIKETPAVSGTTNTYDTGFTVNIMALTGGGGITSISVKALKYVLRDVDAMTLDAGDVEDIYGIYSANGVKFQDNTYTAGTSPGAMSATDQFYIKNTGNGGMAESGYKFELIHRVSGTVCGTFTL